jgi:hypothetical protein
MTKPTLLICPGIPKTGTTTIAQHVNTSNYFHYGFGKENYYLYLLYHKLNNPIPPLKIDRGMCGKKLHINTRYNKFHEYIQDPFYQEYKSFTKYNNYFNDFSIENYTNFYLELAEYTGKDVMDFTQFNCYLPQEFLQECYNHLSKHFNLKILLCYRDPIKRLFSHITMDWNVFHSNRFDNTKEIFYNELTQPFITTFYTDTYTKFKTIFGDENVLPIIYEKYFDSSNDLERKKLFDFINIPPQIIDLSRNYFKADYRETLNQEDITFAKDKLKDAYTLWQQVIGELPNEWI